MKTTYERIARSIEALGKLSGLDLKIGEAVKVSKLITAVDGEMKIFNDLRLKLCEKYGKRGENGSYEFSKDNGKKFSEELTELLETEAELPLEKFEIKSPITIDASSVIALSEFVGFEEDSNG